MKTIIRSSNENDDSMLTDDQKTAIDEALEDVENGRIHSHQDVMEETKKRFPYLFKR